MLTFGRWNKDDSIPEYLISHSTIHKLSGFPNQGFILPACYVSCCTSAFQPQKWLQMNMHYP